MSSLYLFPTSLGDTEMNRILPAYNLELISDIRYFIVEDVRTARRFLKKVNSGINIDDLTFFVLNKHTSPAEVVAFLDPLKNGNDMGLLSEAGCPAVADPGADVVSLAHSAGLHVVPLVGPSSILLALMASGFNGQSFAFNGYLPIDQHDKSRMLKKYETRAYTEKQSQIFIETPYRNMKTLDDIIQACRPDTKLCIAADITLSSEFIQTQTLEIWQKSKPDLNKRPCIFILYGN